jgi:hypothetical protein
MLWAFTGLITGAWAADAGVVLPIGRATEALEGEVAARVGVTGGLLLEWGDGPLTQATPATSLRAGFAPIDRAWVQVGGLYAARGGRLDDPDLATAYAYGRYNIVQNDWLSTGPNLAVGYADADWNFPKGTYGMIGWSAVATSRFVEGDASIAGIAYRSAYYLTNQPDTLGYGVAELGLSLVGPDSPHRLRLGLVANLPYIVTPVLPTASYTLEIQHFFATVQVTGFPLLASEQGIEVGARF